MTDDEPQYLTSLLAPKRGDAILDLGCGTGVHLESILRSSPVRRVVGLDISGAQVTAARRRLSRYVRRGAAEVDVEDVGKALPFPSASFHAVLSVDLMECLPVSKQRLLVREIHRVLKPGGRVLMAHMDWDTQVWNGSDRALQRRLVHAFCDWTQGWMECSDGWMGRKLAGLLRRSNLYKGISVSTRVLTNDRYTPRSFGYQRSRDLLDLARKVRGVRSADVHRFLSDLRRLDRAGDYFYSINCYVVVARRK